MRILIVTNLFPPHSYGGYELCCDDVARRLHERGHTVVVVTSDHRVAGERPDQSAEEGFDVERVLSLTWAHGASPRWWRRPLIERTARVALQNAIARVQPDAVMVWNLAGLPLSLVGALTAQPAPLVYVLADAWPGQAWRDDPSVAFAGRHRMLARLASMVTGARVPDELGSSGAFCFCSASLRRRCEQEPGAPYRDTAVTWLGRNARDFPLREANGATDAWRWRLLYVGRLDAVKGVDTAVRALALLPGEASLQLVGPLEDGHVRRLRSLSDALGLTDRLSLTSSPRRELASLYAAADACIFPSEWDEPFGIVPLEAMACGTPVVATGTGGSGEYLDADRNCVLFTPGDADGLANAVRRLGEDPALRARVVAGGFATTADLTTNRLADHLEAVLDRVVGAASAPGR